MAATVKAGKPARAPARPPTRDHLPPQNGHAAGTAAPSVLRLSSTSDEPEEREPLFYIDDVEYTIPVTPPASIGLKALHIIAEGGGSPAAQMMAEDFVMTAMLGEDGYAALRDCPTLKPADLKRVMEVISDRANAALEDEDNPNR